MTAIVLLLSVVVVVVVVVFDVLEYNKQSFPSCYLLYSCSNVDMMCVRKRSIVYFFILVNTNFSQDGHFKVFTFYLLILISNGVQARDAFRLIDYDSFVYSSVSVCVSINR